MLTHINQYSIDVLVNGNTCKQYNNDGKIFIEARDGSEYEIKISNNTWRRILAVSAVDGLNVLTGETASEEDSGYVINGYDSMRIKGFRYSDEKVGAFKFSSKNNSYAASKGKESAKNVGVIGIRLFCEKSEPVYVYNNTTPSWTWGNPYTTGTPHTTFTIDSGTTTVSNWVGDMSATRGILRCCDNSAQNLSYTAQNTTLNAKGFDMGTDWGQVKESKVREVEFKKGILNFSVDIYYASRESLLEMGVPLISETKVSFPSSFPKKYATPPRGWSV
jgi:hypothetical protein